MKATKNMDRDLEFLFEMSAIRNIERTWKQFGIDGANLAEHIFRMAWIALTLARYEKNAGKEIDEAKLVKMALFHDIAESRTGDVNYLTRQYTKRDDHKAIADIVADTVHQTEVTAIVHEYEERKSIESHIVKDADNLDVEMELRETEYRGNRINALWRDHREDQVFPKLYTESARLFFKKINQANPNDWHNNSTGNRFKGGDWVKNSPKK